MKSNLTSTFAFGIILFGHSLCSAQQESEPQVTTRVDLVSVGDDIPGLKVGKSGKPVTALAFRYRKTVRYSGSRIMEISQVFKTPRRARKAEEEEDEMVPLPPQRNPDAAMGQKDNITKAIANRRKKNPDLVALAAIPPGARHVTVLLAKAENDTYRAFVINDDPAKLPLGRMRVHNFCSHPISLKFNNDKALLLKPGMARQVKPKSNGTTNYLLAYPKKSKWKVQESNVIRITPQEQVQMIILRSGSSFFASASGARGGHLQVAVLRRDKSLKRPKEDNPAEP